MAKLERKKLGEVFSEADLSNQFPDYLDQINGLTSLCLSLAEKESPAGDFRADLIANDSDGRVVVIENQLGPSNHDHLGKLLTYLTVYQAKAAIWIVEEARAEHVEAVTWLNQSSPAEFYMLKVEAVRIGNSDFAPLLTELVGPSGESKEIAEKKVRLVAQLNPERQAFWKGLLEFAHAKTSLHNKCAPTSRAWIGAGSGKRGIMLVYVANEHDVWVELELGRGEEENKGIYDRWDAERDEIQEAFGRPEKIEWDLLKRRIRIRVVDTSGGYADTEKRIDRYEWMTDRMIALEKAFRPYIDELAP